MEGGDFIDKNISIYLFYFYIIYYLIIIYIMKYDNYNKIYLFFCDEKRLNEIYKGLYENIILDGINRLNNIKIVSDIKEADYIFYIIQSSKELDINHLEIKNIDPNKLIIIDYSDSTKIKNIKNKFYFKRSCVNKQNLTFIKNNTIPISFCLKKQVLDFSFHTRTSERDYDISIFFDPYKNHEGSTFRYKMAKFINDNFKNYKIKVGLIGENGKIGRNTIQEEYFEQMKNSKIIITCNPDDWEGDYRLFESLSCKCLVFSDKMITPVINNFIDKKHLIYYDRNNLEILKENLLYYLNNKDLIDEISENGYLHALKYHKPEDRILEIINKLNI